MMAGVRFNPGIADGSVPSEYSTQTAPHPWASRIGEAGGEVQGGCICPPAVA